jgi:hypothetical protein
MRQVPITQVHYDGARGVRIVPAVERDHRHDDYAAIYRPANCVRWDARAGALVMEPRADGSLRTPLEAFQEIAAAVASEYGQQLVITRDTTFRYVTPIDRAAIFAWHNPGLCWE